MDSSFPKKNPKGFISFGIYIYISVQSFLVFLKEKKKVFSSGVNCVIPKTKTKKQNTMFFFYLKKKSLLIRKIKLLLIV